MTGGARRDIADHEDVAGLVTAFYQRAFVDDILGPIVVDVAQMDLPAHLPVMCDFWETVLLVLWELIQLALSSTESCAATFGRQPSKTSIIDEKCRGGASF